MPLSFGEHAAVELCRQDRHSCADHHRRECPLSLFCRRCLQGRGQPAKELVVVPGANHVDLYDNEADKIPFGRFEQFFKTNLK